MRILHRYKKNLCNVQYSIDSGGIEYGLLYNNYAAKNILKISSSDDWNLPTYAQMLSFISYLGTNPADHIRPYDVDNPEPKWSPSLEMAYSDNSTGLNVYPGGQRWSDGSFFEKGEGWYIWLLDNSGYTTFALYNDRGIYPSGTNLKFGLSLRLVRSSASPDGTLGSYTGNNGITYATKVINGLEWILSNLVETKYRSGDWIHGYDSGVYTPISDAAWSVLTTGALCAYNNDWNYVGTTPEPDAVNYTLISGELPITVELIGSTTYTNNHIILESGSFTDIPGGIYTFKVSDSLGCTKSETIEIPYPEPVALNSSYSIDRHSLETCNVYKGFDYTVFGFEGSTMFDKVKITSIPTNGTFTKGLYTTININDELNYPADFSNGLYYRTSTTEQNEYSDTIEFQVRINELWSNVATITINVNSCIFADDCVEYGYLYNWYAATDVRDITSDGWHVPTIDEVVALIEYTGETVTKVGYSYSITDNFAINPKLREVGTTYWDDGLGTNDYGLNLRGAGTRYGTIGTSGLFNSLQIYTQIHTSSLSYSPYVYILQVQQTNTKVNIYSFDKEQGRSIRLVKNTTSLSHGETGVYIGNDGKIYPTICIGTQEWVAANLAETLYRNGDPIPTVEDNTTWAGLTTGAKCAYNNDYANVGCDEVGDELTTYPNIKYGLLYNWYAATDVRNITSSDDWVVASIYQYQFFADYLGASGNYITNSIGGKLKEIGTVYFTTPNTGATNEVGFNARGGGYRNQTDGVFGEMSGTVPNTCRVWSSTSAFSTSADMLILSYNNNTMQCPHFSIVQNKKAGMSIRLIYIGVDIPTEYVGNDGKIYRVITIGTQTWLAENLAETKYRNGDIIPEVTDNTTWSTLTTGALCAYYNDWNNVGRTKPAYYP